MKKSVIRIIALFLCVMSITSVLMVPASAAGTPYNCQYSSTSGGGSQFFYVKTGSSKSSRQISLSMGTGTICAASTADMKIHTAKVYGAYEIKVFYKDSKGKWQPEQDYDVYNKSSATITCNKTNTVYKIQVYFWRVSTTFNSYWNKNITTKSSSKKFQVRFPGSSAGEYISISWSTLPTCTAKPKSGCTLYSSCP